MSINRRQPLLYFLLLLLLLQRSTHAPAGWTASGTLLYGGEQDYAYAGDGDLSYYDAAAAAAEDDAFESERARVRMDLQAGGSGTDAVGSGRADWETPVDNQLLDSANFIAHALLAGSGEEASVLGQGEQYALMKNAVADAAAGRRRDSSEALRREEVALRCKPNSPEEQARLDAAVKDTQDTIEHVTTLIRAMREHAVAIIKDISELEADFLGSCSDSGNSNNKNNNNNNNNNRIASNNSGSGNNNCNNNNNSNNRANNSNINGNANCMPNGDTFSNNGSNMTHPNDRLNSYSNRNGNCNPNGGNNNNGNCAVNFANNRLPTAESAGRFSNNNNLNRNGNYDHNNNKNNNNNNLKNRVSSENFNNIDAENENNNPNGFIGDLNNNNNMNAEGRRPQWNANFNTNANNNNNNNNNKMNNNNNNVAAQPRVVVSEYAAPVKTDFVGLPNQFMEQAQYAVRSWKNQIEECKRLLDAAVQQSAQYERENAESDDGDSDGMRQYIKLIHSPQGCRLNGPEIAPSAAASLTPNNHHDHHQKNKNNDQNNNKSNDDDKGKKKDKLSGGARGDSSKSSINENDKEGKKQGDKNIEKGNGEAENKQAKEKRTFSGIYDVLRGVGL